MRARLIAGLTLATVAGAYFLIPLVSSAAGPLPGTGASRVIVTPNCTTYVNGICTSTDGGWPHVVVDSISGTSTVAVSNFPQSQTSTISNFPQSQTTTVSNFPSSYDVFVQNGTTSVSNFPSSFIVSNLPQSQTSTIPQLPTSLSGEGNLNCNIAQNTYGEFGVSVNNLPQSQTTTVSNFPSSFSVSNLAQNQTSTISFPTLSSPAFGEILCSSSTSTQIVTAASGYGVLNGVNYGPNTIFICPGSECTSSVGMPVRPGESIAIHGSGLGWWCTALTADQLSGSGTRYWAAKQNQ